MANKIKTAEEIIAERKRILLQQQRASTIRTAEEILRSRGKPIPETPSLDIDISPIDTTPDKISFLDRVKSVFTPKPKPPIQTPISRVSAMDTPVRKPSYGITGISAQQPTQRVTPTTTTSNIPSITTKPKTEPKAKDSKFNWFHPDKDVVRKSVFGITYEDEIEEAAKEYIRKTTETPAGQFGTSFLRSASLGLMPKVVDMVTPKKYKEKLSHLGYDSARDVYKESQQKGGLISGVGSIVGSLIPLSKISKASNAILKSTGLAGKSPYLAKSLERVLTGALYSGASTAGEGGGLSDIAKSTGRGALFMAAGGLASDIVGGAGKAALKLTALKDSLPADIVLNIIQGATFGASGTVATMPTYKKEERPGTKEVMQTAVTMALFQAIPATINSIKMSKANKEFIYRGMRDFEKETLGMYNAARANAVKYPEDSIQYYKDLINYINNNKTALQSNIYVGQGKTVNAAIELMDTLINYVTAEMDMVIKGSASTLHKYIGTSQPQQGAAPVSPTASPAPIVPPVEAKAEPVRPMPIRYLETGKQEVKPETKPRTGTAKSTDTFKVGDTIVDDKGRYWIVAGTKGKSMLDIVSNTGHKTKIGKDVARKVTDKTEIAINKYANRLVDGLIKNNKQLSYELKDDFINTRALEYLEQGKSLVDAISNKDFNVLTNRLHRGNPASLELFTEITGLSTKTQKITVDNIRSLDPEAYDKWQKDIETKREQEKQQMKREEREAKELEKQEKHEATGNTRIVIDGKADTLKNHVDRLYKDGYRLREINDYGGMEWVNGKDNKKLAFNRFSKEEKAYIRAENRRLDDEAVEAEMQREQAEYDALPQEDKDEIDRLFGKTGAKEPATKITAKGQAETTDAKIRDFASYTDELKQSLIDDQHIRSLIETNNETTSKHIMRNSVIEKATDIAVKDINAGVQNEDLTNFANNYMGKSTKEVDEIISEVYNEIKDAKSGHKEETKTPIEKKLDELDDKINTIIDAVGGKIEKKGSEEDVKVPKQDKPESKEGLATGQSHGGPRGDGGSDTGLPGRELPDRANEDDRKTPDVTDRGQNTESDYDGKTGKHTPDKDIAGKDVRGEHVQTSSDGVGDGIGKGQGTEGTPSTTDDVRLEEKPQQQTNVNYRITDADSVFTKGGKKTRYNANIKALNTLLKILEEARQATPEEQAILAQYSGWGALPEVFDYEGRYGNERPAHINWSKEFYETRDLLNKLEGHIHSKDGLYYSARRSTQNAHFTSPKIVANIYKILERLGFKYGSILEPSMGIGNFFGLLPETMATKSRLHGVELDPVTGNIARLLYPSADIRIRGFQDVNYPDNYFDIATSNVPFGDIGIYDKTYKQSYLTSKIHNYFFVKSIDKVKPGGVIAFITSTGTLDAKTSGDFRKYIANRANLIAAIRLPNDTFKDNAGTEVTTDLIILQKLQQGETPKSYSWVETEEYELDGETFNLNKYYIENPHMMLGELSKDTLYGSGSRLALKSTGVEIQELFAEIIDKYIPRDILKQHRQTQPQPQQPISNKIEDADNIKAGSYFKKDGNVYQKNRKDGKVKIVNRDKNEITHLLDIKDLAKKVISMQTDKGIDETALESERKKLKKLYDSYVKKYGRLLRRERKNDGTLDNYVIHKKLSGDPELYIYKSLELEIITEDNEQEITEALLFTQRTYKPYKPITKVHTANDGLIACMNDLGYVDIGHIESIYGKPEDEIIAELGDKIYKDPIGGYVTADEYLSGNVRKKLKEAEEAAKFDIAYNKNVDALRKVQPKTISIVDVGISLGESWIPTEYTKKAIADLLDLRGSDKFVLEQSPMDASWSLTKKKGLNNTIAMKQLEVAGVCDALEVVRRALNQSKTDVYDEYIDIDGRKTKKLNKEKTLELRQKVEYVKNYFKEWVLNNADVAKEIETIYNDTFNVFVPRDYSEISKSMTFPNMNQAIQTILYLHQRNGIARAVFGGNTLFAHAVGSGKTYTEIASVMEYRRLGLANKPVMVVPNNKLADYERDFRTLYPGAKILALTEADFTAESIKETLITAATNDWDCVIIRHSSFTKIPVGIEMERRFVEEQIRKAELALTSGSDDKYGTKKLIKKIDKLKERLEDLLANRVKYDMLTFEEIGFDMVVVDEAHEYKNLYVPGKLGSIKGMQVTDADKTVDMLMKLGYVTSLHNNKRGVIFGTGTPISNSMAELFIMTTYLRPDILEERNIGYFDAWARTFADVGMSTEVSPRGGFRTTERFRRFRNLPELYKLFREFADVKLKEELNLPIPELEGDAAIIVKCEPHEELANIMQQIDESWAEAIKDGTVLGLFNKVRAAPVDVRLVIAGLVDHETSKVNMTVKNVVKCYHEISKEKGTQIIFLNNGRSNITGFDLYKDLINKLVSSGIPREEIALVTGTMTQDKLQDIYSKTNKGEIRVLIGTMGKLGTGVNIQERLFAVHEMDVPYRPSDIEQAEGRMLRQGNKYYEWGKAVRIYRYVTQGTDEAFSGDSYMWQIIEQKLRNINSVLKGDQSVRELIIDDEAEDAALMKAIASGNPLMLEKINIEQEIEKLNVSRNAFLKTQLEAKQDLKYIEQRIGNIKEWIKKYNREKADIEKPYLGDFNIVLEYNNKDMRFDSKDAANDKITEIINRLRRDQAGKKTLIGKYKGFSIYGVVKDSALLLRAGGDYDEEYYLTTGRYFGNEYPLDFSMKKSDTPDYIGIIDRAIRNIPKLHDEYNNKLNELEKYKTDTLELASKKFDSEDKLSKLDEKLKEIDKKLGIGEVEIGKDTEESDTDLSDIESELADRIEVDDTGIPIGQSIKIVGDTKKAGAGKEPYSYVNPVSEKRWQESKNAKGPKIRELMNTFQEAWEETKAMTTRGAIPYLERGAKYAQLRFNLINFAKQKQISMYRTLVNIKGIVSDLDKTKYDLFSRKTALDDMAEEVKLGHELAFGFTPDTVKLELERINNEISKHTEIGESIALRNKLWSAIKSEYIKTMKDIGFDVAHKFKKENYYRHLIIDNMRTDRVIPGTIRLRTPTRSSYLKRREGSLKDYVSDYVKAEAEVMSNMLYDIEKAKLIKYVKNSEHNIHPTLKSKAKDMNRAKFQSILAAEANDENVPRNHRGEGPIQATITEYNQYLAMGFGNLSELATSKNLWTGDNGEYADVVERLSNREVIDSDDDASALTNKTYRYLSILASTDKTGSVSAKTILKYTSRRREFIKQVLGEDYKTWRDIIPEGNDVWQPREGNHLYMVYTVPEAVAEQLFNGLAETIAISKEQLKGVLTKGHPYEEYVLPVEVIKSLDRLIKVANEPLSVAAIRKFTNAWKQWQLISPRRVVKYNIRNLTGDSEKALAGNLKIFTKVLPAVSELYDVYFHNKPMTGDMLQWFYRGGMQSTLQVNEIDDINQLKMFVDLYGRKDKLGDKTIRLLKNYWKAARLTTDFREAILRYAAFMYAVEDIKKNDGKPSSYWASIKQEVDALDNIYDKAYLLSNDLLGAYDDVSVFGQQVRRYAIPFYSWMEVNAKGYYRLIKNVMNDDATTIKIGEKALKGMGITGIKSLTVLRRIGKFILCLFGFTALTQAWNMLMFPELEEQLPRGVRSRTHIIFGKDEVTGDIIYFNRIGALGDLLDWFGLDTAVLDVKDILQGRLTLKEYLTQIIQSPINKVVSAAYPFHKLSFELITGRSLFPDMFKPGQIRDKGLHIAQSLGIDKEYRAVFGLPQRKGSYLDSIKDIFVYRTHPGEAAYWDIINEKNRYLEKQGKPHGYGFWQDKKSKSLYWYKVSLRYKDKDAADKYLYEYSIYTLKDLQQQNKSPKELLKGINQSLKTMNPLYGLNKLETLAFYSSLTDKEKDRLVQAMEYYIDTLSPDDDVYNMPGFGMVEQGK